MQRSHHSPAAARAGLSLRTYLLIESNRATFKVSAYEHVAQMPSIPLHQLRQEATALTKAPAAGHRQRLNESENNPILQFLNLSREPGDEVKILPHLLPEAMVDIPLLPPSSLPFHPHATQGKAMENHDLPNLTAPTSDEQDHPETPSQRQATPGQTPHPRVDTEPTEETNTQPLPNENHTVPMDALTEPEVLENEDSNPILDFLRDIDSSEPQNDGTATPIPSSGETKKNERTFLRAVGHQLRTLRRSQQLSIDDLAFHADMSATYLSKLERGQINAALPVYLKIAHVLQVPVAKLVEPPETTSISALEAKVQLDLHTLGQGIRRLRQAQYPDETAFRLKTGLFFKTLDAVEEGQLGLGITAYQSVADALGLSLGDLLRMVAQLPAPEQNPDQD